MRTFLSYDIEEPSVLSKVSKFEQELKATGADLKVVKPDILHFTVRFLGEISEDQSVEIIRTLEGYFPPLDINLALKGLGTFPSERRISVIWIASEKDSAEKIEDRAKEINSRLDQQIQNISKQENERFNPHVTIARVRTGRNKDQLLRFLQEHKEEDFGTARITNLKLKKSVLTPEGPNYSDLHVFK